VTRVRAGAYKAQSLIQTTEVRCGMEVAGV